MNIFWVILPLLFILLPLSKLKPTQYQKRRLSLREHAKSLGLEVQYASPHNKSEHNDVSLCYFFYADMRNIKTHVLSWYRHDNKSEWLFFQYTHSTRHSQLSKGIVDILKDLPLSVTHFEIKPDYIACFWSEQGAIEDVSIINSVLRLASEYIKTTSL
jgi:hypothetical protein